MIILSFWFKLVHKLSIFILGARMPGVVRDIISIYYVFKDLENVYLYISIFYIIYLKS